MRGRTPLARLVSLALACAALLLIPAVSQAGVATKRDKGGVSKRLGKLYKLTGKERRALDIVSVRATGEERLGLVVTVRFRGNIERALGRGHLKRAVVALVLRPKKSSRRRRAGLVTQGAGVVRRKRRLGNGKVVRVATTTAKDWRTTRSRIVGVIRDGRELTFFISGPGFDAVSSIEIKAFARPPRARRGARSAGHVEIPPREFFTSLAEEKAKAVDKALVRRAPGSLSCDELKRIKRDIQGWTSNLEAREKKARELSKAAAEDAENARTDPVFNGFPEQRERVIKSYKSAERKWDSAGDKYIIELADLAVLAEEVDKLIAEKCGAGKTLGAVFNWQNFGEGEVKGSGRFSVQGGQAADVNSPLDAVSVVIPPSGSTPRRITNQLCPSQLPNPAVSTTTNPNDTLTCSGGSLAVGADFTLNVRTSPAPSNGMGGHLYGRQDGAVKGPFSITGP